MEIVFLDSVDTFLSDLSPKEIAKAIRIIGLLKVFGNDLGMPQSKHLSDGLFELRIPGKRAVRILYCFHRNEAVLLHAFIKKTQKTSKKELSTGKAAKDRLHLYNL